jgi:hypothetical protein
MNWMPIKYVARINKRTLPETTRQHTLSSTSTSEPWVAMEL